MEQRYAPGDAVIYRKYKHSAAPGPRAQGIEPEPHGEEYSYRVDKFWLVMEVYGTNQVLLVTRRGKQHLVHMDDPNLRPARWWERVLYHSRFPKIQHQHGRAEVA